MALLHQRARCRTGSNLARYPRQPKHIQELDVLARGGFLSAPADTATTYLLINTLAALNTRPLGRA